MKNTFYLWLILSQFWPLALWGQKQFEIKLADTPKIGWYELIQLGNGDFLAAGLDRPNNSIHLNLIPQELKKSQLLNYTLPNFIAGNFTDDPLKLVKLSQSEAALIVQYEVRDGFITLEKRSLLLQLDVEGNLIRARALDFMATDLIVAENGFYILGQKELQDPVQNSIRLSFLSLDWQIQWTKDYKKPIQQYAMGLTLLANGQLLLFGSAAESADPNDRRSYYYNGDLLWLSPEGEILKSRRYHAPKVLPTTIPIAVFEDAEQRLLMVSNTVGFEPDLPILSLLSADGEVLQSYFSGCVFPFDAYFQNDRLVLIGRDRYLGQLGLRAAVYNKELELVSFRDFYPEERGFFNPFNSVMAASTSIQNEETFGMLCYPYDRSSETYSLNLLQFAPSGNRRCAYSPSENPCGGIWSENGLEIAPDSNWQVRSIK